MSSIVKGENAAKRRQLLIYIFLEVVVILDLLLFLLQLTLVAGKDISREIWALLKTKRLELSECV